MNANTNASVRFFDGQFQRQLAAADCALNSFEVTALPYLQGEVLDYGCGLGNLAVEAARRGCLTLGAARRTSCRRRHRPRFVLPNVRAEAGPTAKRQARAVENAPARRAGLVF